MLSIPNPIFPDRSIGRRDYDQFGEDLLVTKIFPTIQGEGPFAGRRAVFLRLAGCNLGGKGVSGPGCSFCDTDFRFDHGRTMSVYDILLQLHRLFPGGRRMGRLDEGMLVVVTGGEPMLQTSLVKLLLDGDEFDFQIESNGTMLLPIPDSTYLVVSPKVVETRNTSGKYYRPQPEVLHRANCLKFVVSADPSSPYHDVPDYATAFDGPVFVSPMAVYREGVTSPNKAVVSIWDSEVFDQRQCALNHAYASQLAMTYGFIMSVQMHLYAQVE